MTLIPMTEKTGFDGPSGLVMHIRLPGQRWFRLACFGQKSHYRKDGTCAHTDEVVRNLTEYGKKVTKIEPFGNGKRVPKRYADTPQRPIPVTAVTA